MDLEKAIEIIRARAECDLCLEDAPDRCENCGKVHPIERAELKEAYEQVTVAAAKQLPYKPKPYTGSGGRCYCGTILFNREEYCQCGQKLIWD